jgi:hypothetical protein
MLEHQQTQQSTESKYTFQKQATPIIQTPASNPASIIQRAKINPKSLTSADVLQLQRTIGNRAVGKLLSGIRSTSTAQQIPVQRQKSQEDEEPLQGKFESKPEKETCSSCYTSSIVQRQELEKEEPLQTKKENNTGMPDNLKAGVESLSGIDMSDVRVHYNSSKPAEVGALAYAQGTNIHVAPGQERHLPHEAWHLVQQAQGRVKPTMQMKNTAVNDDVGLETEADMMGAEALLNAVQLKGERKDEEPLQGMVASIQRSGMSEEPTTGRSIVVSAKAADWQHRLLTSDTRRHFGGKTSPIQRQLIYFNNVINERRDLDKFKVPNEDRLFDLSPAGWRRKHIGITNKIAKAKYLADREKSLATLISDPEVEKRVDNVDGLKKAVFEYEEEKMKQQEDLRSVAASSSSLLEGSRIYDEIPEKVRPLFDELLQSKRAFPLDELIKVAKKADSGGFLYELQLASSALKQLTKAFVQFGALSLASINDICSPLKGRDIAPHERVKNRRIGADVTVWIPAQEGTSLGEDVESNTFGADFVQAKSIKWTSLKPELTAAMNQLEGQNANPSRQHSSTDAEMTLLGECFIGSIFVKVNDGVQDLGRLEKEAHRVMQSRFVHSVVIEDGLTGEKFIYDSRSK